MRSRTPVLVALVATLLLTCFAGVAVAQGDRHDEGHHHHAFAAGTVTAVDGANVTLAKRSGRTVPVTTTAATHFLETTPAALADVTPGSHIAVDRNHIEILPAAWNRGKTVVSNDGTTITARRKDGSTAMITTNADTTVKRTVVTDLGGVDVGDRAVVAGTRDAGGPLVAKWVWLRPAKVATPVAPAVQPVVATASATATPTPTPAPARAPEAKDTGERGAVAGAVASVAAPNFTVNSFRGARTVSTSGATTFLRTTNATLADAPVGSVVSAFGRRGDDGVLDAAFIRIHTTKVENTHDGWCDEGWGAAQGAVKSNDGETLTIATPKGDVAVRADDATKMTITRTASFGDLAVGSKVLAVGTRSSDGTLAATLVHIDAFSGRPAGGIRHHDGDRAPAPTFHRDDRSGTTATRDGRYDGSRDGSRDGRWRG